MQFLAPTNVFEGAVQLNSSPSADNHAVTKAYLEANSVVGIHSDSANYAELVTVDGEKKLKLKPLTITDVSVDTTQTSLANWITANYSNGNEKQEGDIIVLTAVSGRAETYIHNGGTAGTSDDWAEIEGADVTDAEVRGALSASSGIDYNSATGEFTADQGEIRAFFAAGSGLSYDSSNGTYSLNVNSDGISEGSSNLYHTSARVRSSISVSGDILAYDSGTGVISMSIDTGDVAENGNLYFTNARAIAALSVGSAGAEDVQLLTKSASGVLSVLLSDVFNEFSAGTGLSWDGGGQFSLNATTSNVAEGTRLYFTESRARSSLSAGNGLAYDSSTGAFSLDAETADLTESASALFFTNARAQAAITADSASGNLASVTNGQVLVDIADFRTEFAPQNLTANTFATLNHGLGKKIVHVSAYDSSGNLVQLDVQLVDANNVKVKSVINVTGAEIVVSL